MYNSITIAPSPLSRQKPIVKRHSAIRLSECWNMYQARSLWPDMTTKTALLSRRSRDTIGVLPHPDRLARTVFNKVRPIKVICVDKTIMLREWYRVHMRTSHLSRRLLTRGTSVEAAVWKRYSTRGTWRLLWCKPHSPWKKWLEARYESQPGRQYDDSD
jgi:hypothetical protein